MCGISGIINRNNIAISLSIIEKMTNIISHRGPDGHGYFNGENFSFGHRRLSIIDLSSDGHQPMTYLEKYVITFNGEIYNYKELKDTLISEGYRFNSKTDTEVILAAYDRWGKACVHHFNGMWAFAIYDKEKEIIFCSRDRFGVKPFYYTQIGEYFVFSSEIKQLTVVPGWRAVLNENIAYDFLAFGRLDFSKYTFFSDVYQLCGGQNLIYSLKTHTMTIDQWYKLPASNKNNQDKISWEAATDKFLLLFEDSIKLRLRSDVPVGSCLSGGMDSSSIVCMVNRILKSYNQDVHQITISSCFENKKFDEQEYIDSVVADTHVNAKKIFPQFENLFSSLDKIIWHQDQPFGSTSIFAQWCVYEQAKESNLKVMLDGQGADEYLTGYGGFYGSLFLILFKKFRWHTLFKEFIGCQHLRGNGWRGLVGAVFRANCFGRFILNLHRTMTGYQITCWKRWDIKLSNMFRAFSVDLHPPGIEAMSRAQLSYDSLPPLLHYQDRDSMAHSVESREPFLDYRLVEFVLLLPDNYKIRLGKAKAILRHAMKTIVPDKVLNRHDKMGFVTPESLWLKDNVSIFRNELIKSAKLLSFYLDSDKIIRNFDKDMQTGKISLGSVYWRLICLRRWINVFDVKLMQS